ncbi:hypothetical protein KKI24_23290, partial [bacterium]|nr:hypothetical protein [bacterium]
IGIPLAERLINSSRRFSVEPGGYRFETLENRTFSRSTRDGFMRVLNRYPPGGTVDKQFKKVFSGAGGIPI